MPFYRYKAFDRTGKTISATIDASSLQDAKDKVRRKGQMLTTIVVAQEAGAQRTLWERLFEPRIDASTKIRFTKQLGVLMRSGVPLLHAIDLLSEQFEGRLQRVLFDVKERLQAGEAFASCLGRYPRIFSSVYVQLVRAGEATGKLENILVRLHDYLEQVEETKKRFKKAMTYPLVMLSLAVGLSLAVVLFLVPMFAEMFATMQVTLPPITLTLLALSEFLKSWYMPILAALIAVIAFVVYYHSTVAGKRRFDELGLRTPLLAYLLKTKVVVQFSQTLGMLLDSGVNLPEALDIVANIIDNTVLIDALKQARDKIIKEGKIARHLRETGIFPPIASYMINTGEQSGELPEMLLSVGRDYDIELKDAVNGFIAKINPIMLLVVVGVILIIFVSLFVPIFESMEKMGKMMR